MFERRGGGRVGRNGGECRIRSENLRGFDEFGGGQDRLDGGEEPGDDEADHQKNFEDYEAVVESLAADHRDRMNEAKTAEDDGRRGSNLSPGCEILDVVASNQRDRGHRRDVPDEQRNHAVEVSPDRTEGLEDNGILSAGLRTHGAEFADGQGAGQREHARDNPGQHQIRC